MRVLSHGTQTEILIQDDGPGLTFDSLSSFGKKRSTRSIGTQREGRLSVGLGSVIMSTIAQSHAGEIAFSNQVNQAGQVIGASLKIVLPSDVQKAAAA